MSNHDLNLPDMEPLFFVEPQPNAKNKEVIEADRLSSKLQRKLAFILAFSMILTLVVGLGGGYYLAEYRNSAKFPDLTWVESLQKNRSSIVGNVDYLTQEGLTTPLSISQVSALTADSVVEIQTERTMTDWRMGQYTSTGAGSGVIIDQKGYILTNQHVIDGASTIVVGLRNGDSYPAVLIGSDHKTDIALLKIEADNLTTAVFGDSSTLVVGEIAIAIGNPLGQLGGTVTDGIISALDRELSFDGKTMNLLQTNAAINPGNSGGGLFNIYGELIGIVVAKSSGTDVEGLGFAIPINDVKTILTDLMTYGYVEGRIDLKMTLQDVTGVYSYFYGYSQGVYIASVQEGSNAAKTGFKVGDYITAIDGTTVSSVSEINALLDQYKVGDSVKIKILRNNRSYTGNLVLEGYKG